MDIGESASDWVVRLVNYSPPSELQAESRSTTMEALFEQYRKARGL
jgi:probable phosphoglycerate mutase